MKALIFNEFEKLIKGRLLYIAVLLAVLFPVFAVSQQSRYLSEARDKDPSMIEKQIQSINEKLKDPSLTEEQKSGYDRMIERYELAKEINQKKVDAYKAEGEKPETLEAKRLEGEYLNKTGITPEDPFTVNAFTILSRVLVSDEFIFVFLIVALLGGSMVSSEYQPATIKMLITRAIPRWKIIFSKFCTLLISSALITLISISVTFVFAGLQYGWGEANYPVSIGGKFAYNGNPLPLFIEGSLHIVPRWLYAAASSAHAIFACIAAAAAAFSISTVVTRKVLSLVISFMGVICLFLLGGSGNFMSYMSLDPVWSGALLSKAMNGNIPVGFAEGILAVWLIISLLVSLVVFRRRDIMA